MNFDAIVHPALPATTHPAALMAALPATLLDEIEFGLVVCDAGGSVHFANAAARRLLAASRLLRLRDGRLEKPAGVAGHLDSAVLAAASRGRRSLVQLSAGDERLGISAQPVAGGVLLIFGRQRACSELGLELLGSSYRLTAAERRVLAALLAESTPREIAREFGVALSTVRTQIASMRAKLGTRGIEGLLLRVAEAPPVASALRWMCPPAAPRQDTFAFIN